MGGGREEKEGGREREERRERGKKGEEESGGASRTCLFDLELQVIGGGCSPWTHLPWEHPHR